MRFGKLPPKIDYRTLDFQRYIKEDIPEPPEKYNALERVYSNLGNWNTSQIFPMDGNDTVGDCTVAASAHAVTLYHGLIRQIDIPLERDVIKIYNHLTGGVDSGLAMLDVLNYWRKNGMFNNQITAFMRVNPHNHVHVKQAIKLFGGLYMGFQVPENAMKQFIDKTPWTVGKLLYAGHAVHVTGYDNNCLTVLTWGATQEGLWSWWDYCVDECYAILPPEAQEPDFAPGFDFEKLKDDLAEVAIL